MMYCTNCQIEYPAGQRFCRRCGDPLEPGTPGSQEETSQCPHCCMPVSPEDTFCGLCGAGLEDGSASAPASRRVTEPKGEQEQDEGRPRSETVAPSAEILRCLACRQPILPGDVVCESCGVSLVDETPSAFASRQGIEPNTAGQSEEETFFTLEEELKRQRREVVRGVGTGVGAGLLLAGLIIGGLYYWRICCQPPPPVPVVSPPAPAPGQLTGRVMTAEELGLKITGVGARDPGRTRQTIREQVEAYFPGLAEAYGHSLQTDPTLKGGVTLHITVAPDGKVANVKAEPRGIADTAFVGTVQTQVQAWQFPPISTGVTIVHYPLLFYPEGADPKQVIAALPKAGPEEPAESSGQPSSDGQTFPRRYKVVQLTYVRDKPTWASKAVAELRENTKITVVGVENGWLKVQPRNQKNPPGYVWQEHAVGQ